MMTIDQQKKIRCRLLNKLGIYQETSSSSGSSSSTRDSAAQRRQRLLRAHGFDPMTVMASSSPPDGSAVHGLLDNAVPFEEPLKCHHHDSCSCDPLTMMAATAAAACHHSSCVVKPTKIQFHDKVSVVEIPSRHAFSNRIKSKTWTNRYELAELQERNILEFTAEGWNWEAVVEDDQMYLDAASGEMVHPIHIQLLQERQHQQQYVMNLDDKEEPATTHDDETSVCAYVP